MFSGLLATEGRPAAVAFAEETLAALLSTALVFVLAMEAAMPWLMYGLAPGFAADPEKFALAVELARLTFPYLLFMALVSLLGGILNSLDRFAAMAATPILLNLTLIAALLGFTRHAETAGHALAWGVAVAGVIQLLFLVGACWRAEVRLRLRRPRLTPRIRRLLRLILPAAVGAGVVQVNLLVDVVIASLLPTGAVSFLYYADRVNQLPLGVVGVAVGTALLPLLTRQLRGGETAAAMHSQNRAVEVALLLTIPAAAALMVVPGPIVSVLFQRGAFGAAESGATAGALAAFALGLPAYVLVKVLAPGFFAREDTATPVKIAVACMVVNLVLNLLLMRVLAHVGIALATALSSWLNCLLLAWFLWRRDFLKVDVRLKRRAPRMVLSAAAMAALLWGAAAALSVPLAGTLTLRVAALAALVLGGAAVFFLAAQLSGAANLREMRGMLRKEAS